MGLAVRGGRDVVNEFRDALRPADRIGGTHGTHLRGCRDHVEVAPALHHPAERRPEGRVLRGEEVVGGQHERDALKHPRAGALLPVEEDSGQDGPLGLQIDSGGASLRGLDLPPGCRRENVRSLGHRRVGHGFTPF
jgi:hypothetical protein